MKSFATATSIDIASSSSSSTFHPPDYEFAVSFFQVFCGHQLGIKIKNIAPSKPVRCQTFKRSVLTIPPLPMSPFSIPPLLV